MKKALLTEICEHLQTSTVSSFLCLGALRWGADCLSFLFSFLFLWGVGGREVNINKKISNRHLWCCFCPRDGTTTGPRSCMALLFLVALQPCAVQEWSNPASPRPAQRPLQSGRGPQSGCGVILAQVRHGRHLRGCHSWAGRLAAPWIHSFRRGRDQ